MANIWSKGNRPKGQNGARRVFINCNDRIRAREVRLIGENGNMVGVVPIEEARAAAHRAGLDLIEISPNAVPPVCRILDFGKYQYEVTKKQKISKATGTKVKEVKFRFCTETHDYETKVRHIIGFLTDGDKVKVSLFFRKRELDQTELGFNLVRKLTADLEGYATLDAEAKFVGRNIIATYSPIKNLKQKQQAKPSMTTEELKNTVIK